MTAGTAFGTHIQAVRSGDSGSRALPKEVHQIVICICRYHKAKAIIHRPPTPIGMGCAVIEGNFSRIGYPPGELDKHQGVEIDLKHAVDLFSSVEACLG